MDVRVGVFVRRVTRRLTSLVQVRLAVVTLLVAAVGAELLCVADVMQTPAHAAAAAAVAVLELVELRLLEGVQLIGQLVIARFRREQ